MDVTMLVRLGIFFPSLYAGSASGAGSEAQKGTVFLGYSVTSPVEPSMVICPLSQ